MDSKQRDLVMHWGYRPAMHQPQKPSARVAIGTAAILLIIFLWGALVASLARIVGSWPVLAQAPFYLVMGLAWIVPLKPLVRWMQTGEFRARR